MTPLLDVNDKRIEPQTPDEEKFWGTFDYLMELVLTDSHVSTISQKVAWIEDTCRDLDWQSLKVRPPKSPWVEAHSPWIGVDPRD